MAVQARLEALVRYGGVGVLAAAIHAAVLWAARDQLGLPLPLANLLGFGCASFWGYFAHAVFTFRPQTGGTSFPRRWLLIQASLNVSVSLLLPLLLGRWAISPLGLTLMVFTPTAVNYGIWSLAARHSQRRRRRLQKSLGSSPVRFHADDLGLHPAVNQAICSLHDAGMLDSASVLITAPALALAQESCEQRPQLELHLHLCLSEGWPAADPALVPDLLDSQGRLAMGFGQLLLLGVLPTGWSHRRRLERQLALEITAQIQAFQQLFPGRPLQLDGHQHIHLLPLVWRQLRRLPPALTPVWIRTLREPWPWRGIPLRLWIRSGWSLGPVKWLVLQLLNQSRETDLQRRGIATNPAFCGLLFSGCMDSPVLDAAQRLLAPTGGLVLLHPSARLLQHNNLAAYPLSSLFYGSSWREREADALIRRIK